MCGSGRYLIPLLKCGFKIQGFDASKAMITALNLRAKNENVLLDVDFCLFKDFKFKKKYNLIFIPSGSFGLIIDFSEVFFILHKIYDSLNIDGTFIFEVETKAIVKENPDFNFISNKIISISHDNLKDFGFFSSSEFILGSFLNLSFVDSVLSISCRYDLISQNQIQSSQKEILKIRLYSCEELYLILIKAGFSVSIYKDFDKSMTSTNDISSKLLLFECVREE